MSEKKEEKKEEIKKEEIHTFSKNIKIICKKKVFFKIFIFSSICAK
jgi:hypothetical protein